MYLYLNEACMYNCGCCPKCAHSYTTV
jgi:hypothetical protein